MELSLEQGNKKRALEHLRLMIENGYQDKDRLLSSSVGQQLSGEDEFKSLIESMRINE